MVIMSSYAHLSSYSVVRRATSIFSVLTPLISILHLSNPRSSTKRATGRRKRTTKPAVDDGFVGIGSVAAAAAVEADLPSAQPIDSSTAS